MFAVFISLGPVLGPSIGGFLISIGGWPLILFINIPYYLERLKHMSSWKVGLINLFTPLAIAVFSQISGNYNGKLGQYKFIVNSK